MDVLRGALILRLFVERMGLTQPQAATRCGLSSDRFKKIARGKSCPLYPDVKRIEEGLGITFRPEDWEQRGLTL